MRNQRFLLFDDYRHQFIQQKQSNSSSEFHLNRRADDHGVFMLLDPMMPSRLKGAFPEGVELKRVGLAEAVAETGGFLQRSDLFVPQCSYETIRPRRVAGG